MNLFHLRYFLTLARLEHYTRAADELRITQPSLSHAISALENELGVKLFEKAGRNVKLTKYGKAFQSGVRGSLRQLDACVASLKSTGSGEGVIELGFVRAVGTDFVPRMVQMFLQANPEKDIRFSLSKDSGNSNDLLAGLRQQQYDVVLCSGIDCVGDVDFVPVAAQELVAIVPLEHALAGRSSIDIEETMPYPQIIFKKEIGLRSIVDDMFQFIGAYPNVLFEVEEDQVAAGFVANGFGIAIVPNMVVLQHMPLKILPIRPCCPVGRPPRAWQRRFHIATLKEYYRAPVVENFRRFVIEHAEL